MFKEFEVFDIAEALYFWLQDNWEGQSDELYSAYCELTAPGMFKAGTFFSFGSLNDSARFVYDNLARDNYRAALNQVLNYESQD